VVWSLDDAMKVYITYYSTNGEFMISLENLEQQGFVGRTVEVKMSEFLYNQLVKDIQAGQAAKRVLRNLWWKEAKHVD
jgi:hypothetical protein